MSERDYWNNPPWWYVVWFYVRTLGSVLGAPFVRLWRWITDKESEG